MRQVVLDTETTGLSADLGHRIIEIGCVELVERRFTNNNFHTYLNPERDIDVGAQNVHGLSSDFLQDKPRFYEIANIFLEFISGSELIIHNAVFDVGFINSELKRVGHKKKLQDYCLIQDTLILARQKHPGLRNNLDALCKRYKIDNTKRKFHGALLDAEILAWVYLAMTGGQVNLMLEEESNTQKNLQNLIAQKTKQKIPLSVILATKEELLLHQEFLSEYEMD